MNGWGGLIELILVFGAVLGWGVREIVGLRRYKEREARRSRAEEGEGRNDEAGASDQD